MTIATHQIATGYNDRVYALLKREEKLIRCIYADRYSPLRIKKAISLLSVCVISLSLFFVSFEAKSTEPSDFGCDGSTLEQHGCMAKLFSEADKELNTTYQSLIRLVRNHGEEWAQDLRSAQRKWIEYRDLNCKFYGNYLKGGSGEGLFFGACKIRMTRERASELQKKRQEMMGRGYQEKISRLNNSAVGSSKIESTDRKKFVSCWSSVKS